MTRYIIDGKPHRMRRGKMVEIPAQWLGQITTAKTLRERETARRVKLSAKGRRLALREVIPEVSEWD